MLTSKSPPQCHTHHVYCLRFRLLGEDMAMEGYLLRRKTTRVLLKRFFESTPSRAKLSLCRKAASKEDASQGQLQGCAY